MKRTITALLVALLAFTAYGCASAAATEPQDRQETEFAYVHDWSEPKVPEGAVRIAKERDELEAAKAAQAEQEAQVQEQGAYYGYDESMNNNIAYLDGGHYSYGDGFMQQGVREYNGRTETWYSSNQAYHYRTNEWTVDDEGYYRDSEGHYVVAVSDKEQGTVFQGSKGECIVLDSGCEAGVTDYYVAF